MMKAESKKLVRSVLEGNTRGLSRVISHIENSSTVGKECVEKLFRHSARAFVIGITGSPGAGKSTLADQLASQLIEQGKRVAVLAIDPSSPFSGGAILGDRIRMINALGTKKAYVRSMASRGALGGLAPRTMETIFALEAAGYDFILLETVGVGQGEVEVVRVADCVLVVLVPGMGDAIQAMKAGILEIANIFVINKADMAGADRLKQELLNLISLVPAAPGDKNERPKIVQTTATSGEGIRQLWSEIGKYQKSANSQKRLKPKRSSLLRSLVERELARELVSPVLTHASESGDLEKAIDKLYNRKISPHEAAKKLISSFNNLKRKRPKQKRTAQASPAKVPGKRRRKSLS